MRTKIAQASKAAVALAFAVLISTPTSGVAQATTVQATNVPGHVPAYGMAIAIFENPAVNGGHRSFATSGSDIKVICHIIGEKRVKGFYGPPNADWAYVQVEGFITYSSGWSNGVRTGYIPDVLLDTGGDISKQTRRCATEGRVSGTG